jgi:predicted house-cleaning noncanonical NTP pyrophosphatase (MazG superfamily)
MEEVNEFLEDKNIEELVESQISKLKEIINKQEQGRALKCQKKSKILIRWIHSSR